MTDTIETFIQHPKYKRLLVGNNGTLVSNRTWKILKTVINKDGYLELKFIIGSRTDNSRRTLNLKAHRLVAEMFLYRSSTELVVNHKDGNKKNNTVGNLEWITVTENNRHAIRTGLRKPTHLTKDHQKKLMDGWRKWKAKVNDYTYLDRIRGKAD